MGKADLRIDWATHEAAKYACVNWHYSGCLPVGKLVKVGAWENSQFIGVVLFGRGANKSLGLPYGCDQTQCVELVRIALQSHVTPVSRMVAHALCFLKKTNPKLRLVVSFADTAQGHHGGVYQAGNWIYAGDTKGDKVFIVHGRQYHQKSLHSLGYVASETWLQDNVDPKAQKITLPCKHRYLMPLDADMKASIMHLAKPYPKRVKQAMADDQSAQRRRDTDPHAPKPS